jgi:phosphatidate cytidylyltransferase
MRPLPSSFLPRLLSTVLLWAAVVAVYVLRSEPGFAIMISIPVLISLWEYFALLKSGGIAHHRGMGMTAAVILIALNFLLLRSTSGLLQWSVFPCEYAVMAFFVMALFLREYGRNNPGRATAEAITFTLFGVVYIPWLFLFMAKLLYLTPHDEQGYLTGQYLVLFVIAVTKFTDVGAFLCGSLFGRTPFFPNISPKKTWEGIIGGMALGVLVGAGVFHFFGQHLPSFSVGLVCGLSFVLAIAGVAGDLAESLLKRSVHTKDSGHALPGIGGGLDLIDSLLFTLPLFYFILLFVLHP